jgi:phosphoglycolate phosphatase
VTERNLLVVFDLDGTLVDSARDLADAGNALLKSYGAKTLPPEDVIAMVGEGARELVRKLLEARRVPVGVNEALARFLAIYNTRLVATTRPYDGIVPMLEASAAHARLAVLTNKPARATARLLDALELRRFFTDVIAGDDAAIPRKPDPTGLLALVERAGVAPSRALMVGDSPIDVRTAVAAGVPLCLVRWGFGFAGVTGLDRAVAAYEVDRPSAVSAIVGRLADSSA